MDDENQKVRGVIDEVGLERDKDQFNSFNLKIGMVVKSRKTLTFEQAEQMMKQFKTKLLGKKAEITAIVVPCPICGKGFNTEQGMKQHIRMVHEKKRKVKTEKTQVKKSKTTRKRPSKKRTSKKKSGKK